MNRPMLVNPAAPHGKYPEVPPLPRSCMMGDSPTHFGIPYVSSLRSAVVPLPPRRTAIGGPQLIKSGKTNVLASGRGRLGRPERGSLDGAGEPVIGHVKQGRMNKNGWCRALSYDDADQ